MVKPTDFVEEMQRRFQIMADAAPVMVWMSDVDKLCDFFNEGWLRFTGRTLDQELGNGWAEGVHPEDLDRCLRTYTESFDARQPFTMEYRLRRHDGAYRWILDNGVPRFTPSGQFMGYIGSCTDVHEQRETRERLEQTLAQQQMLVREIHHRVRNNLQLAVSLISNVRRRFKMPDVREELSSLQQRLLSMARIYDKVFRGTTQRRVDLGEHIGEIVAALDEASLRHDRRIEVDAVPLPAHIDVAIPVSLIATELLIDAMRRTQADAPTAMIRVILRADGDRGQLIVHDDRADLGGLDENSFGLVRLLTAQIKARLDIDRDDGTRVALWFDPRAGEKDAASRHVA